jgi:uncharacterized protein (TIGR03437 family)
MDDSYLPMNYVGPDQINVLTTTNLPVGVTATFKVHTQMSPAPTSGPKQNWQPELYLSVATASADPALFTADGIHPWIVHFQTDGHADTQAAPGETVSFYGNAFGPVQLGSYNLMWNFPLPQFTIGDIPAVVVYSGLQPDFFGLYQANVQIPLGIPDGSQPLVVVAPGLAASQPRNITINSHK